MSILTISGSTAQESSNTQLLKSLPDNFPAFSFSFYNILQLPLFIDSLNKNPLPEEVINFRNVASKASSVIISTPEYTHNIPAVLKSAFEWVTSSGELANKKVIAITYTPYAPRGEKAMVSLINSLKALDANILASLDLYANELWVGTEGKFEGDLELIKSALDLI